MQLVTISCSTKPGEIDCELSEKILINYCTISRSQNAHGNFDLRLKIKQLLANAFSQAGDSELNRWIERVGGLVAGHSLIHLVAQDRVDVHNVSVDFACLH